jgi:biotin synthase-related radical SAM superfamily protein
VSGKEGNIISFKVFIDRKGTLMTEFKQLPIEKISKVFDKHDAPLIKKIISEAEVKLSSLHEHLEKELNALR